MRKYILFYLNFNQKLNPLRGRRTGMREWIMWKGMKGVEVEDDGDDKEMRKEEREREKLRERKSSDAKAGATVAISTTKKHVLFVLIHCQDKQDIT